MARSRGDDVPLAVVTSDGGDYEAAARTAGATSFVASLGAIEQVVDLYVAFVIDAANRCACRTTTTDRRANAFGTPSRGRIRP